MMDFSRQPKAPSLNDAINDLVNAAIERENAQQTPRAYLGGSRLGVECLRALAYEWHEQRAGERKAFPGKVIRRFLLGHMQEAETARWLRMAGFELYTERQDGGQFGFGVARDPATNAPRIAGHIDGCIASGPLDLPYPLLWEHKIMNNKKWGEFTKKGVAVSHPVYFGQCQTYMGYMDLRHALMTAWNSDTSVLGFELIAFDPKVTQDMTDRGVRVIESRAPEELPRITNDPADHRCRFCDYAGRCWAQPATPAAAVAKPAWLTGG